MNYKELFLKHVDPRRDFEYDAPIDFSMKGFFNYIVRKPKHLLRGASAGTLIGAFSSVAINGGENLPQMALEGALFLAPLDATQQGVRYYYQSIKTAINDLKR